MTTTAVLFSLLWFVGVLRGRLLHENTDPRVVSISVFALACTGPEPMK